MASGAGYLPFVCFTTFFVAWSNMTFRPTGVFSRNQSIQPSLRALGLMVPSIIFSAVAMAVRSRACSSTTRSTSPIFFARSAFSIFPVSIRSSAFAAPTIFGSRCVPPQPGSSPSMTSGTPRTVLGEEEAMRCAIVIENSMPPPRHAPSIAATHGFFFCMFAIRSKYCWPSAEPEAASSAVFISSICLMFAPAIHEPFLPDATTTALILSSASTCSIILTMSL